MSDLADKTASLAKRLRHAMTTMQNDDLSAPGTDKRARHVARVNTLLDAAELLESLAREVKERASRSPVDYVVHL